MDVFDIAQRNDELFRQNALRAHFAGRQNARDEVKSGLAGPASGGSGTLPLPIRICCDCGDEIEPERLEALPYAARCGCQIKHERRVKARG